MARASGEDDSVMVKLKRFPGSQAMKRSRYVPSRVILTTRSAPTPLVSRVTHSQRVISGNQRVHPGASASAANTSSGLFATTARSTMRIGARSVNSSVSGRSLNMCARPWR